jgi:AAA family ATP:ADP antiporter
MAAGAILLLMLAGHTVLETARDSLFLARLSVRQLPWTYGAIAVSALLAAELNGRLRARLGPGSLLLWTLAIGALGDLAFVIPFHSHAFWAPHAFYVFIAVIATLATSQFWLLSSELFTVVEAKRSFATISAGGLLGAMLGAALARVVSSSFGDTSLLWFGAGLLVASGVLANLTRGHTFDAIQKHDDPAPLAAASQPDAMRDPEALHYLKRLLLLGLLATVTATLVDYMFKAQVAHSVPKEQLSSFFANFNAVMNAGALVLQLLLAPRLLSRGGIGRSITFVPLAMIMLGLGVFAAPALWSVLVLRATDGGLRYSLLRSALEVLYLPLPRRVRARWKTLVDLVGQRGGQALASLGILAFISAELNIRQMAATALPLTLVWLWIALTLEPRYVALFRARVKAGAIETRAEVPALDLRSLETLVAALGSEDDDEVLASITLLVDYDLAHVIPALLLYHPSRTVVLRALEVFANAQRKDYWGTARRLLDRDDDELRAAAMLALAGHMSRAELESELAKSPALAVRAVVLVALMARDEATDTAAAREVRAACAPEAGEATRLAFARALRLSSGALTVELSPRLLTHASRPIELEVARAMAAAPSVEYLPYLIGMLDSRHVRDLVRDTLLAIGAPALAALQGAASDSALPRRLHAHIPRSISRFDSPTAADMLLDMLESEHDGWVRFKVVRGLGQLRQHIGDSHRLARVDAVVRSNLEQVLHYMNFRLDLKRDPLAEPRLSMPGGKLLIAALADKEAFAIDRAVRLTGLRHSGDTIHNIRQALAGSNARLHADSAELLVHRAPEDIASALTALLATDDDEWRLTRTASALSLPLGRASYAARLQQLLDDPSEAVRGIAAFHVRELGMLALREPVSTGPLDAPFVQELLGLADRMLEPPLERARRTP